MAALISVLIAITLSLLITRIATEALTLTGLSSHFGKFSSAIATQQRIEQEQNHSDRLTFP